MEKGWIKLHRKLIEKGYYKRSQYVHLWVHLLLIANHKPREFMFNGHMIMVKEGQMITGRKQLVEETGIPATTIERILEVLENEHQIGQQKTTKYRLITIVNWESHQKVDNTSDSQRTTNGQPADTNKNVRRERMKEGDSELSSQIIRVIDLFKEINPSFKRWYGNTTQRGAIERLLQTLSFEKLETAISLLKETNTMPYAPIITTPQQLEDKLASLRAFVIKEKLKVKGKQERYVL